jgi:hypothetical protein
MAEIDDILRAEPDALGRLAGSHRATWQCLARHMCGSDACPPQLVHALLAIDDPRGWESRLFSAFLGLNPDEGMGAHYDFRRWFGAGIVKTLAPSDIEALRVRYTVALDDTEIGGGSRVAALVADIENASDGETHRALLGRALLLLARRLGEADDHERAIAAARRAEDVFTALGEATWSAQAVRMRGGALLRQRKIDDALAVLDTVADAPSAGFASEGSYRGIRAIQNPDGTYRDEKVLDPIDAALDHAAAIALWATKDEPHWIAALGRIADQTGHPSCAARSQRPDIDR